MCSHCHFQNPLFYFEKALTPIRSHAIPRTPMDGHCRWGETSAVPIGRPLPSVHGRALGEEVALFMSTYVNKVDRKGRVSVPATFRTALAALSFDRIVAFPSLDYE